MSSDCYVVLTPYGGSGFGPPWLSRSQVNLVKDVTGAALAPGSVLPVLDVSFDVEQSINIGSTSGAGAGKVSFNAFSLTRAVDELSPLLFQNCCSGTPFAKLDLLFTRAAAAAGGGPRAYLQYTFKLAAVATIAVSDDDEGVRETVTFQYGGLQVRYAPMNVDGSIGTVIVNGWNRVRNVSDIGTAPL